MSLIQQYGIEAGDIVSRQKRGVPLITHYGIPLGYNHMGQYLFIENMVNDCVRVITAEDFLQNSTGIQVEKTGNRQNRQRIIDTALSYKGTPYSLTSFNCEHFVNLVRHGQAKSKQVSNATAFLGLTALVLVVAKTIR
jgi:hypothetical protein